MKETFGISRLGIFVIAETSLNGFFTIGSEIMSVATVLGKNFPPFDASSSPNTCKTSDGTASLQWFCESILLLHQLLFV